jgi:hypothetical protein
MSLRESGGAGRFGEGMSIAAVERHYGVNDSMICYVKKNEDKI